MSTCCAPGAICVHYPKGQPEPKTYHKDIGFPEELMTAPPMGLWLCYTPHAKRAVREEGVMPADLPARLPGDLEVIEVEVQGGYIQKWVLRIPNWKTLVQWDNTRADYDLVLAVLLDGTVKTVWLNAKGDTHRTLQRHRYTAPSRVYVPTPSR